MGGRSIWENVEWAYNGAFPFTNNVFTRQTVWCRNFNSEMNITKAPVSFGKE